MPPQKLYTIEELAREVGRSPWFIRGAIRDGLEHHRQRRRGTIYITPEQWSRYMEQTLVPGGQIVAGPRKPPPRRGRVPGRGTPRRRAPGRHDPAAYADIEFEV